MFRRLLMMGIIGVCALILWGDQARGGFRYVGDSEGGGGVYVNLIVREVKVTPIHAHVGDVIRIEMVTEDVGDLVPNTVNADIYANGKIVVRKLVTYGYGGEGGRLQRATFLWDTHGYKPGEYHMKGEVFVWYDASPFDNYLDVDQPLVLLPAGEAFPPGVKAGGVADARDPRYKPAVRASQDGGATEGMGRY